MTMIRVAETGDIPWMCVELRKFATFVGTKRSLFPSVEKCVSTLEMLVAQHPVFVAISRVADQRLGFIGGTLTAHPMNEEIQILTELFWWVTPECRGGRAGLLLLQAFQAYGRAHADHIVMTLEEHSPVNPETLTKRGFRVVEHTYLLEV